MTTLEPTLIPQPAKRGRGTANELKKFAARLKDMPGQWMPYPFMPSSNASAAGVIRKIRTGSAAFPKGEFEVFRSDDDAVGIRIMVRAIPNG